MAGYTKGPWAVNEDGWKVESEKEHGWVNDGWVICNLHGTDKEANASLIAAAPDLFEALEDLLEYDHILRESVNNTDVDAAHAAIAKAKGQDK